MCDSLSARLQAVFDRLGGRGRLTADNIQEALREVRVALLEADVNLQVANDFVKNVTDKALGQEVIKSLQPGQLMVKICHDELVNLMGPVDTKIYTVSPGPTGFFGGWPIGASPTLRSATGVPGDAPRTSSARTA